jgi:flagellar FliL protein
MKGLLVALLLSTLIGAGLGVGYARFVRTPPAAQDAALKDAAAKEAKTRPAAKDDKARADAKSDGKSDKKPKDEKALHSGVVTLPPVVAALAAPEGVWLRIDASMVVEGVEEKNLETLKRAVAGDMVAFVATLSLPQVQGALGLQHLREDLEERVILRSEGKARSLAFNGLVIQ